MILAVNSDAVKDSRDLARKIGALKPGASVELKVWRDGRERVLALELGRLPGTPQLTGKTVRRSARASTGCRPQLSPAAHGPRGSERQQARVHVRPAVSFGRRRRRRSHPCPHAGKLCQGQQVLLRQAS